VASHRLFCAGRRWHLRTLSLAAAFFLAACSGHSSTLTLSDTGHRLHFPESFCSDKVFLQPPTSTEHAHVPAPRISKSDVWVHFVGRPPVPDIVYARIRTTDIPEFNNTPEWAVIYRDATITPPTGGISKAHSVARPIANETVLLLFDPTSGSPSALRFCPAGV
jgi:hypothetical protein